MGIFDIFKNAIFNEKTKETLPPPKNGEVYSRSEYYKYFSDIFQKPSEILGWGWHEIECVCDDKYEPYFQCCEKWLLEKDIQKKIQLAETSLKYLPEFLNDCIKHYDMIPPDIPCREFLPKEYMKFGLWEKAEQTIIKLAKSQAMTREETELALIYLSQYKHSTEIAVKFLLANGGFLQRNLYDELLNTNADRECLKAFTRSSYLLDKVRVKGTNKLYINQNILSQSDMKNIFCNGIIA